MILVENGGVVFDCNKNKVFENSCAIRDECTPIRQYADRDLKLPNISFEHRNLAKFCPKVCESIFAKSEVS